MSPRHYRSDRRRAAAAETRRRILDSTVALHAEQGVLATSYAMIAARADVAVPTVYNHFPTRADLLAACTGEADAHAPAIGPDIFATIDTADGRLRALVAALFAQYRYYAPWLRWAVCEAPQVPELAGWLADAAGERCRLIVQALTPAFDTPPPASLVALCEILLDFPAWQRLTGEQGPGADAAEAALGDALAALVAAQRATAAAGNHHDAAPTRERAE